MSITPTVGRIVHVKIARSLIPEQVSNVRAGRIIEASRPDSVAIAVDWLPDDSVEAWHDDHACLFSTPRGGVYFMGKVFDPGEEPDAPFWAEWMPYQVGQAAKTEQAEGELVKHVQEALQHFARRCGDELASMDRLHTEKLNILAANADNLNKMMRQFIQAPVPDSIAPALGFKKFTYEEIETRFSYHPPKGNQARLYELMRKQYRELAIYTVQACPASREATLALEHLEMANFYANAAIARRTDPAELEGRD